MRDLHTGTLRWAVGAFCAVIGALMLVSPHQFAAPTYAALQPALPLWGVVFFSTGLGMLGVAALSPRKSVTLAAHLFTVVTLLVLVAGFVAVGGWTGTAVYSVLGLGTLLAAWPSPRHRLASTQLVSDLFALVMGVSAVCNGILFLGAPDQFTNPIYNLALPYFPWFGAGFLSAGLLLAFLQLRPPAALWVDILARFYLACVFGCFLAVVSLPYLVWTGIAFYGGFGIVLVLHPLIAPKLRRADPRSLRVRLALMFAAAAAVPLIAVSALQNSRDERVAIAQILTIEQTLAHALAQNVADYVGLHRAAVTTLSSEPGLLTMPVDQQRERLQVVNRAYNQVFVFSMYAADGTPLARSDDLPLGASAAGLFVFDEARRTNAPSLELRFARSTGVPIVAFGAPMRDAAGRFAGLVGGAIEQSRLEQLLQTASVQAKLSIYLVDDTGRAITKPGQLDTFASRADEPPVAALLARQTPGQMVYVGADGNSLAGYAPVPGLGWGIVVEQSAVAGLAALHRERDITFGLLLVVIATAALLGAAAARRVATPLKILARAVQQLAQGDSSVPLPQSSISEAAQLLVAFGTMRQRLAARTAERDEAEAALRFLAEATSELASSLDYQSTLTRIARLTVPDLADLCLIDMLADDGTVQRVASAYADPTKAELVAAICRYPPDLSKPGSIAQALQTGEPVLVPEVDDTLTGSAEQPPELVRLVRALHMRSLMVVPLRARGRTLGAISLSVAESGRSYSAEDLVLAQDLAQRAAVAIDNVRLYQALEEAVRVRDIFLSVASHELKTPLTAIQGFAELLQRRTEQAGSLNPRDRRSLQLIVDQAGRLNRLIGSLLDISRIQMDYLDLRREPVDMHALAQRVVAEVQPTLERHTVELSGTAEPLVVEGDDLRLEQVIQNLVQNAIKYSPEGGPVTVRVEREGSQVCIAVQDTGIGVPPAAQAYLFQRFYRAENVDARNISGMGIGLYLVHEIVTRLGGSVAVASTEGQGSTFTVRLPLAAANPAG